MISLHQLPVLDDNYVYLLWDDAAASNGERPRAIVVDPATSAPVSEALEALGLRLGTILVTHHHGDHVGGIPELVRDHGAEVVGNALDRARIPHLGRAVTPGDVCDLEGFRVRVLSVAAHTRGHVAYAIDTRTDRVVRRGHAGVAEVVPDLAGRPILFVGDSLFGAGCGRLFEGDADDLHRSLTTLAAEDPRALVCCAHEYTRSNLAFAAHAYPASEAIRARIAGFERELGTARASIPSTLALELATNPFLLGLSEPDPVARVFALRRAKDGFRAA